MKKIVFILLLICLIICGFTQCDKLYDTPLTIKIIDGNTKEPIPDINIHVYKHFSSGSLLAPDIDQNILIGVTPTNGTCNVNLGKINGIYKENATLCVDLEGIYNNYFFHGFKVFYLREVKLNEPLIITLQPIPIPDITIGY